MISDNAHPPLNPYSFDTRGFVSIGDGVVRRFVIPEVVEIFEHLQSTRGLDALQAAGLVGTRFGGSEPSAWLSHDFLPFTVYPQEFTIQMWHEAALCTLDIAATLCKYGMHLHDAHPWNVSFRHGRPVYLDFTSLQMGKALQPFWAQEFFVDTYLPLWLASRRYKPHRFAQFSAALRQEEPSAYIADGSPRTTLKQWIGHPRLRPLFRAFWNLVDRYGKSSDPAALLAALRDHVAALTFPQGRTEWDQYSDPGGAYDNPETFNPKARAVHQLLSGLQQGRLVDLACNTGWFSGLAASMGHTTLGVDLDTNALEVARLGRARGVGFDVATMNVVWPTPPQSRGLALASAPQRWQCDTVLMAALVHHLVLRQRLSFEAIAHAALAYGPRNLIVEFIPRDDVFVRDWPASLGLEIPDWYDEHVFERVLSQHFPRMTRLPSGVSPTDSPEPTRRVMYLFQR